ncbi:permease [Mangrovicoccus sp. HB161399]|uniref:permease n=1 Tax=Mangrovicoccus sp. HB161399 TaxID=2720392 RepID=UPI0015559E56|nr:permease [Mangrovicoccus sp. HB161399]
MTLICAEQENGGAAAIVADAFDKFERASRALNEMIRKLEDGDCSDAAEAKKIVAALDAASDTALKARMKLDERNKQRAGIAHDFAIDFDAARSEIGRRLACLRRADGQG